MNEGVIFASVIATAETDKAILVEIDDEKHWVPKSQIHDDSEVWKKGQSGTLIVSQWYAEQKGWME